MLIVKAVVVFSSLRCRYLQNKQQIFVSEIATEMPYHHYACPSDRKRQHISFYRISSVFLCNDFRHKKAVLTPHKQFIDPTIPTNNRCFFQWLCYALTRRLSVASIYVPIMRLRQRMRVFRACFIFSRFFKNLYNSKERRKKLRLSSTYLII